MIKKAIRSVFVVLLLIFVLYIFIQLNKNQPLSIIKELNLQNRLLTDDKRVVFKVSFLAFLPVGEAELSNKGEEVYKGKTVYHLSAKANVSGLISKFFNAQAQIDTYIDKDRLHSLMFRQALIIPDKPKEEKEILYDQDKNIMELEGVKRQILPDTQDPLSAMFYIRHQAMELGKEFDININTNQKNYRLYVKVIKKDEYAAGDKKVGVWVLEGDIRRRDKSPRHSTAMTLYLLDNPAKTPFLVKVTTGVASITARVVKVE